MKGMEELLGRYKRVRQIDNLYDWQLEFLFNEQLLAGRANFILSLPTSAGKTIVAEVLMLREAIINRRNSILILPYVAIVQEKIVSLSNFESEFGLLVEEYSGTKGRFPPIRRRSDARSFYVCTIEKANILVNSLIENKRLQEIGLVIVDELHMLGEKQRGATLEQCICKLKLSQFMHTFRTEDKENLSLQSLNYQRQKIQLIGMSATISSIFELLHMFGKDAELFSTEFRPVKLIQRVKIGDTVYRIETKEGEGSKSCCEFVHERELKNTLGKRDPDGLVLLLNGVPGGSVIVFCPTRQNCENLCKLLASLVPKQMREHRLTERQDIIAQLRGEHEGQICPILQFGISSGIAYHHSGLTGDERLLIESAYKSGIISIICATSTLAAGVNLPARRVIIRSPFLGREPIKKSQYLQMAGRAGRAGLDEKGDSIVILHPGKEFKRMLEGPLEPCRSGLFDESLLEAFILDLIFLKLCTTRQALNDALGSSLYGIQLDSVDNLSSNIDRVLQSLVDKRMIQSNEENMICSTILGSATYAASLSPQEAKALSAGLQASLGQGLVLSSHFHLLYTIVPAGGSFDLPIDWNLFHNEYLALSSDERRILHQISLPEAAIIQLILTGRQAMKNMELAPDVAMRMYIAFMLRRIWRQEPIWQVAKQFNISRGWLQSALQSACSHSGAVVRFAERTTELWPLRYLLPEIVKKLSECKQQELIPLLGIDCVKIGRAQLLYAKGFRTVGSIARSTAKDLIAAADGKLNPFQARRMISSAKAILRDQMAEKLDELDALGALPENNSLLMSA